MGCKLLILDPILTPGHNILNGNKWQIEQLLRRYHNQNDGISRQVEMHPEARITTKLPSLKLC